MNIRTLTGMAGATEEGCMRIGLIGCGWIVERGHAVTLREVDEVQVVAASDLSRDRALLVGDMLGLGEADCVSDYRAVLERADVDLVSVGTPPATHREIVCAAAAAGKHVICEKPIATTLADADAMIDACEQAGVLFAMYHNYLYYPETIKARELIAEGVIGEVAATELTGLGLRPWVGTENYRPGWRHDVDQAGGGALMDAGVHGIYLSEVYHGRPIDAVGSLMRYESTGVDAYAFCQLKLGSGIGLLNIGWVEGGASLNILGSNGYLSFVYDEAVGYYGWPVRAIRVITEGKPSTAHYMPYVRHLFAPQLYRDLADAVAGERASYPAYGPDGRKALEVALAAYSAHGRQARVPLPLDRSDPVYTGGLGALVTGIDAAATAPVAAG
jgi:UDP-N-acetyl-2-amino-2-deoxyglucuronate dehydrogenase